MFVIGTTSTCAVKLFRNAVALENDVEQACFINMQIKTLWECLDRDEEVGAKPIAGTERFQASSRKPIPPLVREPRELIELDDELLEDPTVVNLTGLDVNTQNSEDSSQKEDKENAELIAM